MTSIQIVSSHCTDLAALPEIEDEWLAATRGGAGLGLRPRVADRALDDGLVESRQSHDPAVREGRAGGAGAGGSWPSAALESHVAPATAGVVR